MRAALRRLGSEEGGFTLVELLVASMLGVAVIGGAVMMFTAAIHNEPQLDAQDQAIQTGRVTMERIVRELRQGSGPVAGTTPTASHISLVTYVDSTCSGTATTTANQCSVTYNCSGGTCTRQVAQVDGSSPAQAVQVASGLSTDNVFSCSPSCTNPSYIGVTLSFSGTQGSDPVTLTDGAAFRNASAS